MASSLPTDIASAIPELDIEDAAGFLDSAPSLREAATRGLILVHRFSSTADWQNRHFLVHLDEFLRRWTGIAAWRGIEGPLGQTNVSKARIVIKQMLGGDYYRGVHDLASSVVSGLYSERRIKEARTWYDLCRSRQPLELLAPIELAEGNVSEAKKHFLEILLKSAPRPDDCALHYGYYGMCLVLSGRRRDGFKHLEEALSIKDVKATTTTRLLRAHAKALFHAGDRASALRSCDLAASIARREDLESQVRKAQTLKRSFEGRSQ